MERQYESFLKALLAPLGIYDLSDGTINEAELFGFAAGLDAAAGQVEYAEREALTATAEDEGLRHRELLFARRPAAVTVQQRRDAIAALFQIDGDSFSLADINKTISGCGIRARAVELGQGKIRMLFPEKAGVPDEFDQIQKIVLDFALPPGNGILFPVPDLDGVRGLRLDLGRGGGRRPYLVQL